MFTLSAIVWDIDPEIVSLFGKLSLRYYSLLFAGGLLMGYVVIKNLFLAEKYTLEEVDKLALYIFIATIVGARLGHCLFYEPEYYLSRPLEMLLPFTWEGGNFKMTGFRGLASHGGILGVFISIWYFSRKTKKSILSILDKVAVGGAISGAFIRFANFMNSEIIGKPTDGDYGVIFKRVDMLPRHPAQLYEAIAYLSIFFILLYLYKKKRENFGSGFIFGLFFTLLFLARFVIEFFKENQVGFEDQLAFNMGQLLSIPFMLAGIAVMIWKRK